MIVSNGCAHEYRLPCHSEEAWKGDVGISTKLRAFDEIATVAVAPSQ